jgi:phosphopantothenoylcysteine decarboxylase/phosphopantothenate--cysteine ligase
VHLLITAGPTREPIDAVRFLSNRSSGKLGLALADAALASGHRVTLLLGPIESGDPPAGCTIARFESTEQLQALLSEHFPGCDAVIMAAAVADYRPVSVHEGKLPRGEAHHRQTLELEPTPDLVQGLAADKRADQRVVAFALETADQLEDRARAKLERKGVDALVANALATMGSETITLRFLTAGGADEQPGAMPKAEAARWLINRVERLF